MRRQQEILIRQCSICSEDAREPVKPPDIVDWHQDQHMALGSRDTHSAQSVVRRVRRGFDNPHIGARATARGTRFAGTRDDENLCTRQGRGHGDDLVCPPGQHRATGMDADRRDLRSSTLNSFHHVRNPLMRVRLRLPAILRTHPCPASVRPTHFARSRHITLGRGTPETLVECSPRRHAVLQRRHG
jgi:hypothetical protein